MTQSSLLKRLSAFLLDVRTIAAILQIAFVVVVVAVVVALGDSMLDELQRRNISPTFNFLNNRAGFELADSGSYTPDKTYRDAFMVGVINTLRVVSVGLVLTTILGVVVGIALLSHNWLVRNIARVYVEILRNTPLLVQIFVWFYIIILPLPRIQDGIQIPPEGITVIPLRWLLFVVFIPLLVWFTRRLPEDSLARMFAPIAGVGLMIAAESLKLFSAPLLRLELEPVAFLSNRGVALPVPVATARFDDWAVWLLAGFVLALGLWWFLRRRSEQTGRRYPRLLYALGLFALAAVAGWFVVSAQPPAETVRVTVNGEAVEMPLAQAREQELVTPELERYYQPTPLAVNTPRRAGLRYADGMTLLPEYTALLLALVVYTSAFIAEIVRAGIQAVPHGQIEAGRALGLSYFDLLRLIILPQALRVIIPPLGNQYLNLAKNSSLAIAISYTDVFQVTGTIINQTGQSVSGILLVMATYLILCLVIAAVMNFINSRFQLKTARAGSAGWRAWLRARFRNRAAVVTR